jgi:hypothetical protein
VKYITPRERRVANCDSYRIHGQPVKSFTQSLICLTFLQLLVLLTMTYLIRIA